MMTMVGKKIIKSIFEFIFETFDMKTKIWIPIVTRTFLPLRLTILNFL